MNKQYWMRQYSLVSAVMLVFLSHFWAGMAHAQLTPLPPGTYVFPENITTVAGGGTNLADNIPVVLPPSCSNPARPYLYIAELGFNRVWRIDLASGASTAVAGDGISHSMYGSYAVFSRVPTTTCTWPTWKFS